jgi:outer membrane autotransporter protein
LYGGNSWNLGEGKVNVLLGGAHTWNKLNAQRDLSFGKERLKSSYNGNATQLFANLGYAFPFGERSQIEPYVGAAWFTQRTNSFQESRGAAALRGEGSRSSVSTATLGLRGSTSFDLNAAPTTLRAGLGFRHAMGNLTPMQKFSFVQGEGSTFSVLGAPIARNAVVMELSGEVQLGKNAAIGVRYTGQYANQGKNNAGSLYLRVRY